jgi:membrane-anchored protein YejM (alkaline phosphatase superfamily)
VRSLGSPTSGRAPACAGHRAEPGGPGRADQGEREKTSSRLPGSSGRDRTLTDEWQQWLDRRDAARPFFGFLYYDAAVAIEPPDDHQPAIPVPPGSYRLVVNPTLPRDSLRAALREMSRFYR